MMSTLYRLKPQFQSLLRPLLHRLHALGISANLVTSVAAAGSLAVGAALVWATAAGLPRGVWLCLPVFLFVRMAMNAIDGMLAREYREESRLGAFLNEIGDVVSDAALYAPFACLPGVQGALLGCLIALAGLAEFCGVIAQALGGSRRYDGPLGKSDRAFVFGAAAAAYGVAWIDGASLNLCIIGLCIPAAWTCVNRVRAALAESTRAGQAKQPAAAGSEP